MSELESGIEIFDLRDRPEFCDEVIDRNLKEFGALIDMDREDVAALFKLDVSRDRLPVTLIAVSENRFAGCVSLREKTMGAVTHPEAYLDESPWLSNMIVSEWARGRGIASRLTEALEKKAREHGITRIYSSTEHGDSLYHKLGYQDIQQKPHKHTTLYLIYKDVT